MFETLSLKVIESAYKLYRGATDEEIQRLEESLGVALPFPYRRFLLVQNGAQFRCCVIDASKLKHDWVRPC
ncbi:MAG: SMI1/KNR4 family protein, partial [Planctomycetaceae bacterium]|nr:SMI1/KNR4 family protein [Planctomycetaceae bacterium]